MIPGVVGPVALLLLRLEIRGRRNRRRRRRRDLRRDGLRLLETEPGLRAELRHEVEELGVDLDRRLLRAGLDRLRGAFTSLS